MKQATDFITQRLISNPTVTDQIAAGNIYPVLAAERVEGDFLVFMLIRRGPNTKDRLTAYELELNLFASDLTDAMTKMEIIEQALLDDDQISSLYLQSSRPEYTEDHQEAYISTIFEFKYKSS